jgi:REP element-mobilizing transposase RayT
MTSSTPKFKGKYQISSNRLKGWDYGTPGYYFVTICTKDHKKWFGNIIRDQMILSPVGEIVEEELEKTSHIRSNVYVNAWVVMPNHVHAIIVIGEISEQAIGTPKIDVETPRRGVSTKDNWRHGTLGAIINQYKSKCTKRIHAAGYADFAWQALYYDHIIRNDKSIKNIHAYIIGNPIKWDVDEYFSKI